MKTEQIIRILKLKQDTQLSDRQIAEVTDSAPTTVARYWRIYLEKRLSIEELEKLTHKEQAKFFQARRWRISRPVPDWTEVHRQMAEPHATLEAIWEEYRQQHPDGYGYSQFTALYRQFTVKLGLSMRQIHRAGESVFVDFAGSTVPWTDPLSGDKHRAEIFVAVMGCSNLAFVLAVASQKLADWIAAHNALYQFLGGVTAVTVPDNLRSAVTRAGRDLVLNKTYRALAQHYDTIILPARPGEPQDKAKVEAGVRFVSRWIIRALRKQHFSSVSEINAAIVPLLVRLNQKPFKKLPGCRQSWFEELDKPALKPLPAQQFEYAEWNSQQKVPADYHVMVRGHYYSVPHTLVAEYVETKVSATTVEIFNGGRKVASHPLSAVPGGQSTLPEHQPPSHRAWAERSPEKFGEWAQGVGSATSALVHAQFLDRSRTPLALRACDQLKGLARRYGSERFEAACARAMEIGSPTVKSVRSILGRGIEAAPPLETTAQPMPKHDNIRGADYFGQEETHVNP